MPAGCVTFALAATLFVVIAVGGVALVVLAAILPVAVGLPPLPDALVDVGMLGVALVAIVCALFMARWWRHGRAR